MPNLLLSFAVGFPYVPQPPPPCGNTWTVGRKTARRRLAKAIRLLSVVRYFSPANFSAVATAESLGKIDLAPKSPNPTVDRFETPRPRTVMSATATRFLVFPKSIDARADGHIDHDRDHQNRDSRL